MNNDYLRLCLITNLSSRSLDDYEAFMMCAARGGITSVQLREKNASPSELKILATKLQSILKPFNIPLIINDHVDIAVEVNADGVHLGQADMSPSDARVRLGPDKIIGLSIETLPELAMANELDCINYIAASALFDSQSKTHCKTLWGLTGLKQLSQLAHHPVIGIGGIDAENVTGVIENGAEGVAVISAIHNHPDPEAISTLFINKINKILLQRSI